MHPGLGRANRSKLSLHRDGRALQAGLVARLIVDDLRLKPRRSIIEGMRSSICQSCDSVPPAPGES
jgi:hypothetical protein